MNRRSVLKREGKQMDNQPKKPVAVVIGAGPGLGASLIRRFAKTYSMAILARKADYLKALAGELRQSGATVQDLTCDVRDRRQITDAFRAIRQELGDSEVLLYNAGSGTFGGITEVAPAMIARGHGTILFTGATAGVKAGPKSVSFGPAKFAMRGLAQSLARDLGPRGIHVAWISVDGSIDIPGARGLKPSLQDGDFLKPDAIAETYWHLAHQDPSAWTMELEVRPFKEKF